MAKAKSARCVPEGGWGGGGGGGGGEGGGGGGGAGGYWCSLISARVVDLVLSAAAGYSLNAQMICTGPLALGLTND